MYTTVYGNFDTPEGLAHGLDTLPVKERDRAVLMVSRRQAELLDGQLVEPAPVEVAEGEEAPAPAAPAPVYDDLNLKLWQRQRASLPTLAVGDLPPEEADLKDIANGFKTYLNNGKILLVLRDRDLLEKKGGQ